MKTSTLSRGQSCAASRQGNESTESSNGYNRVVPYRPRFCENTIGTGAAARTASLVYQQLKYWSRHSQHHYDNKLWFYKSGEELAEELSLSVSTVRRALKRLLSLGLLVRQQLPPLTGRNHGGNPLVHRRRRNGMTEVVKMVSSYKRRHP